MDLEIGLITGNFGVKETDLIQCDIVRFDDQKQKIPVALEELLDSRSQWSVLERFRLAYFRSGSVEGDPEILEEAIDPRNWTVDAPIRASLGALVGLFSQFLLAEYTNDVMTFYPILRFHARNYLLLEWLTKRREQPSLYQAVAGVHLTLTREIEEFLAVVEAVAREFSELAPIHLAAEGPLDSKYFANLLGELGFTGIFVGSVMPRNSPVDLAVTVSDHPWLIALVALVLSTRTRIELGSVCPVVAQPHHKDASNSPQVNQLVTITTGFLQPDKDDFVVSIRTIMPRSLLLDLHLEISLRLLKRARDTFLFFLSQNAAARREPPEQESRPK
jgi:hypothetical protein